jgi:N-acetylneuraminic acid mutarotase
MTCFSSMEHRASFRPDHPFFLSGWVLNDLYSFNPAGNIWTNLMPAGSIPSGRQNMGFTASPDGKLYLFGGDNG